MKTTEKYYIVYFNSITQYDITHTGYYVSYKNKLEDNYSDVFVFAKRYNTIGLALKRANINYKGSYAVNLIKKIENGVDIFSDTRIEVVKIDNIRKRKLTKLNGESDSPIKNLGVVSKEEILQFLQKEADKILRQRKSMHWESQEEIKTATPEEIDDFCSHLDKIQNQ
jgi:hypothetical protein